MEPLSLAASGVLYSWTVVHVAPAEFPTPYVLGYVDLPEGVRILAQIDANTDELYAGLPLTCRLGPVRRLADGSTENGLRFGKQAAA